MAKRKKIDLDTIPEVLSKIAAVIDREVSTLSGKDILTSEDAKNLINYATVLSSIYKDYRAECQAIAKDLKTKNKDEILSIVKAETN